MKQWFVGRLEGHFVGQPDVSSLGSLVQPGEHHRFKICRALVHEVELGPLLPEPKTEETGKNQSSELPSGSSSSDVGSSRDSTPPSEPNLTFSAHHEVEGAALSQENIPQVHFLHVLGPGRSIRGAAFDILASELDFSHPARHEGKTYGRVTGTVSGWYRPPAAPAPAQEVPPETKPDVVWSSEVVRTDSHSSVSTQPEPPLLADAGVLSHFSPATDASAPIEKSNSGDEDDSQISSGDANLRNEGSAAPDIYAYAAPEIQEDWPFFSLGAAAFVILLLGASPYSAGIWSAVFLPVLGVRKWLFGVVPNTNTASVFGTVVSVVQLIIASLLVAHWATLGCKELTFLPLFFLLSGVSLSCLLPRPLPFALCCFSVLFVLFQYYGLLGPSLVCGG